MFNNEDGIIAEQQREIKRLRELIGGRNPPAPIPMEVEINLRSMKAGIISRVEGLLDSTRETVDTIVTQAIADFDYKKELATIANDMIRERVRHMARNAVDESIKGNKQMIEHVHKNAQREIEKYLKYYE